MTQPSHLVLVVEDDEIVRWNLAEYLTDCGFNVLQAADADQAKDMLAESNGIEMVITDINMPGSMDGTALARWLWQVAPRLPVILVSGRFPHMVTGANRRFLPKPYNLGTIEKEIRDLLPIKP